MILRKLGFALCVGAAAICDALHIATFITLVPPVWILPTFALLAGAVLCTQAFKSELRFKTPSRNWGIFGFALLFYAILSFVFLYRPPGAQRAQVSLVGSTFICTRVRSSGPSPNTKTGYFRIV